MDITPITQEEKDRIRRVNPTVSDEEIEEFYQLQLNRMLAILEARKTNLPCPPWTEENRYKELVGRVHV